MRGGITSPPLVFTQTKSGLQTQRKG